MGQRGPVPKRSSERRRRNKESKPDTVKPPASPVRRPRVSSHWHPIAKSWFTSLATSGQAIYFEPSDWQAARVVAEMMSRNLKQTKPSAQMFATVWAAMTDLLTTEASRRRVRMEVERDTADPEKQPAGVTAIADYRKRLGA